MMPTNKKGQLHVAFFVVRYIAMLEAGRAIYLCR